MKFLKSKTFIFVVLIIVCFIAGALAFSHVSISDVINKLPFTPKPSIFVKIPPPTQNTSSWKTFSENKIKLTMKYPSSMMLDPRQTVEGRIYAFIYTEDQKNDIENKVPTLYVVDTHSTNLDGFSAFKKADCGSNCNVLPENSQWVNLNNLYGIKNPQSKDIYNYFLTDKKQSGDVVNVYIGGYKNMDDPKVKQKVDQFDQVIKTIQFSR
ncbi:MAG: hypothetical protein ACREHC_08745 [Candidatus Levyibacteriota bacterium]